MKLKSIILISSLFIIIGITLKCNNYYQNYKIQKQEINSIANYLEHKDNNDFVAILEIPKINLKRGLKKDSNVDEDITIIDYQRFLNNDIILASHSGNCSICYFNRLDELKNEDIIYFNWLDINTNEVIRHPNNPAVWKAIYKKEILPRFEECYKTKEDYFFLQELETKEHSKYYYDKVLYVYNSGREHSLTQKSARGEL